MSDRSSVTDRIFNQWFGATDGEMLIGGQKVSEIANEYGSPLYLIDADIIREKFRQLTNALPWFKCYYSIKANPNPTIIRLLGEAGCGMEIASRGELELAEICGISARSILFAGPGKSDADLQQAVERLVSEIHVESLSEIKRLNRVAARANRVVNVALRVNPSDEVKAGAQQMGGKPSAFGIDEENLEETVEHIESMNSLRLNGLHVYAGTQLLDAEIFAQVYQHIATLAQRITALTKRPLENIDFGGGFGVPYFEGEQFLDLKNLYHQVKPVVDSIRKVETLKKTNLIIEPGRFLTAEAGIYVARVLNIKQSRGTSFAVLDGGMNHHLSASGQLGQIIKRNFPIVAVNKVGQPTDHVYELAGPLCTPLDTLGRKVSLPELHEGDLIAFLQSGAYARTSSPHGFLSHPAPKEILADKGKLLVIRESGSFSDLVRGTEIETL